MQLQPSADETVCAGITSPTIHSAYLDRQASLCAPALKRIMHVASSLENLVQLDCTRSTVRGAESQGGHAQHQRHEDEKDCILPVTQLRGILGLEEKVAQRTAAERQRRGQRSGGHPPAARSRPG